MLLHTSTPSPVFTTLLSTAAVSPSNSTGSGDKLSFDNLYPAILQCFVVVASGYIAGRTGHVTASQSRGIGTFVATFCLPALLFRSMCTMDFTQVNWLFLLSILIAKASVFFLVALVTLLVTRGSNLGYVGIFAIFCTQSNDFAVGYPILQALYQDSHQDYLNYIYLIAPISLCILNPIGFILMEIQRRRLAHLVTAGEQEPESVSGGSTGADSSSGGQKSQVMQRHRTESEGGRETTSGQGEECSGSDKRREDSLAKGMLHVAKGVLLNPIVFMTAIGIVGNFVFHQKVPGILNDILVVLGDAFSACALFYLGLSMVGQVRNQMGLPLLVPLLLIFAKTLLLPLVTWEVIGWVGADTNTSQSLSMYGFLYGTFPTAPSVFLFASQYEVAQDIVATGMVAGTFLSAPLMFVSAKMMTLVVGSDMDYHTLLLDTSFDTSIVGIICCVWVLGILVLNGRWRQVPHRFTVCLLLSQLLGCIGMVCYHHAADWQHYMQFIVLLVGVYSSRCWTAALAVALCLLHVRSLCLVLKIQVWLFFLGFGLPIVLTGLLFLLGAQHIVDKIDPSFHYGFLQLIFSTFVLLLSLVVTVVSVVVWQRKARQTPDPRYSPLASDVTYSSVERPVAINSSGASSPNCSSPSKERKDYQACATGLKCANINIEDLIPFPPTTDETKSLTSDSSCTEDHGIMDSGSVPVDERMCLLGSCDTQERIACRKRLRRYAAMMQNLAESPQDEERCTPRDSLQQEYQSTHHLLLLLLLSLSMFVGLFLCTWKIFNQQAVSGIYIELEFLDSVFSYGQSFLVFTVFGFDTRLIFSPLVRRMRRWLYGTELVHLPKQLDEQTRTTCHQFLTFHIQTCRQQLCKDRRFRLRQYQKVFLGSELCDWLQRAGLAVDRPEAVAYGRRLLLGRVLAHVTGEHHFHDSPYFYRFVDDDEANC